MPNDPILGQINVLHMHMYLAGDITLNQLLIMYPAETSTTITTKATSVLASPFAKR
jgi:hypothetical protein